LQVALLGNPFPVQQDLQRGPQRGEANLKNSPELVKGLAGAT
jgi:hypothetical protein